jgi:hypothetical protein
MAVPDFLAQALEKMLLTQRALLRRSAVLGGTAALAGVGSGMRLKTAKGAAPAIALEGNELVAGCWISRGLRQPNYGYVQDGVVILLSTEDSHLSSSE